ncbi:MAG TPA: class I SAM-dependent methyltransferase [Waterburya sp.]|jgi:SAM-dependent methyltransferase
MPTEIIYIDYEKSEALERELAVFQKGYNSFSLSATDCLSQYPTAESYFQEYLARVEGLEFQRQIDNLSHPCKVLDVGVGRGESSIYLALKGYSVSVVEPSPDLCKVIASFANLYNLSLNLYNCSAECIDKIGDSFDLIIFNSSFHHCDNPLLALNHCYNSLKDAGKLILVNEPILQFFRTKKWFYNRLETHPKEMGHYGGNEHIYRYHEYINMLKLAGFSKISSEPNIYTSDYKKRLQQAEERIINGKPFYNSRRLALKKIYYYWLEQLKNGGILGQGVLEVMKRSSMLQTTFLASK